MRLALIFSILILAGAGVVAWSFVLSARVRTTPESPNRNVECRRDDDCATAGCSGELCTTVARAAQTMTACRFQPADACRVYDACGCQAGRCGWAGTAAFQACSAASTAGTY